MKKRGRVLFLMILAFFAGVLTTLYLLVPGKYGPTILVNGDEQEQIHDLDSACGKLQKASDVALYYAYQAKNWVSVKSNPKNSDLTNYTHND